MELDDRRSQPGLAVKSGTQRSSGGVAPAARSQSPEISQDEESGVGKKCRVDSARNRDEARNTDTRCSC